MFVQSESKQHKIAKDLSWKQHNCNMPGNLFFEVNFLVISVKVFLWGIGSHVEHSMPIVPDNNGWAEKSYK